jgi:hypothetical protein
MIRENQKLPKDVTKRIPVLIDRMSEDNHVIALFAFGSLATGQLKRLSDLDFKYFRDNFDETFLEGVGYRG